MVGVQINPVPGLPGGFPVGLFFNITILRTVKICNILINISDYESRSYLNSLWNTLKIVMSKPCLRYIRF